MHESSLVLYNGPEFVDYTSYYLPWYDSSNSDTGPSGELLSYSQEGLYEGSNFYEEIDDYYSRSWYANGSSDQEYKDTDMAYSGSGNWLREYESYFDGYWGGDEVYSDKGYEAYGNSLEKEESPGQEQRYGNYDSSNDDTKQDYNENQWLGYGGFGFGFGSDGIEDDFHDNGGRDFHYNSSWDDFEEVILYERIFGDWHSPLTLDN